MPIPLRKLVKTLNFEKRHKRDYLSLWDNLSFLFAFSFLTCSIWREYLMTRRGRFQMPSGRLTFPIHNLCDQNRQKSIKKSEFWNFVKFWKKILKGKFLKREIFNRKKTSSCRRWEFRFWTRSDHWKSFRFGCNEIYVSGLHEILEIFLRDGDGNLLFVIFLFTYLQ